jgi:L-lactate dehydrogenase complex protein LldG
MSAREDVLARVRRALADRPAPPPAQRSYLTERRPGSPELLAERIEDYRATVHTMDEDGLPHLLARLLPGRTVLPHGVPEPWVRGVTAVHDDPPLSAEELDACDGVLTTCAVAIAETGTVVLDGSAGQGRRALTLVPDHHVVVVRADQVVAGVPGAIARLDPRRPQTWISGPSATSDIELQRVEGVHGPRRLDVVLLT